MHTGTGDRPAEGIARGVAGAPPPLGRILRVGSLVFLFTGTGGGERKFPTRLLGWREGRFLMVALPRADGRPVPVSDGDTVVLRYVLDGDVYGFRAEVLRVQYRPEPLLFLAFPAEIENVPLRSDPRVPVRLPAVVSWLPGRRPPSGLAFGFVRDLTADGGLLEMPLGDGAEPLGRSLHLTFALGVDEEVRVNAVVRNDTLEGPVHRMGIAFNWTDPDERDRVATFCGLHGPPDD